MSVWGGFTSFRVIVPRRFDLGRQRRGDPTVFEWGRLGDPAHLGNSALAGQVP